MAALMTVDDAITYMKKALEQTPMSTESIELTALDGRILAKDQVSTMTVPAFDNSAMDGYALHSKDAGLLLSSGLKVVGEALAGHPFTGELRAGEAVRIMTGAQMPQGADSVIMQEEIQRDADCIFSNAAFKVGQNVRYQGEDIRAGEVVLAVGTRLTPIHIGLLASIGVAEVSVYRKLKVALFSSGDELCQPGVARNDKQIYDSNRYALKAMLERLPVDIIQFEWLPDNLDIIRRALAQASEKADVIITSAGVSVGDADYTKQVLEELGQVEFWKVAMKPGKPFAFGKLGNCWFFGLPGNPVSSMVTLDQLAQPALRVLSGEHFESPKCFDAKAATVFKKSPGRQDFQRVTLNIEQGELLAAPSGNQGSGLLKGFSMAVGYAVLEADRS